MKRTLEFIRTHPLTRGQPLCAFARFFRWQMVSRVGSGRLVVPFANGTRLDMRRGMTGATGNWYCGLHEPGEMGFLLHVLQPGELFVDAGANIGSYTVLAGGAVGADVAAFEPIPTTFAALERNVALNALGDRVRCYNLGLGAAEEILRFTSQGDTVNHVLAEGEDGPSIEVPVRPLDDVLDGRCPTLVKIDVEGWEAHVLAGMPKILADPTLLAVIMETNSSGERYGVLDEGAILRANGFRDYSYDAVTRTLSEGGSQHNTVFIRDPSAVEDRIAAAGRTQLVTGDI